MSHMLYQLCQPGTPITFLRLNNILLFVYITFWLSIYKSWKFWWSLIYQVFLLLLILLVLYLRRLPNPRSWRFIPMLSSKILIILAPIFRSLICDKFLYMVWERGSNSFFCMWMHIQLSQHHLLKRLFFPHCIVLEPLLKMNWP